MSTNEEYPPCPSCLTSNGRHPTCNDPTKRTFQRPVRPEECRRCPGAEITLTEAVVPEPGPPPFPPPRRPEPPPPTLPTESSEPPAPAIPGLIRRAYSYAEALARWTAAGQPVRPDKEVERIFNEHCKTCKWFDPERQICRGCGCRVAETGMAVVNKIKMATENCPRELW